jgi:hypothetical protein
MPHATPDDDKIGMPEVERMANVNRQTVTAAIQRGELRAVQRGPRQPWFFDQADVEQWIELRSRFHPFVPDGHLVASGQQ